MEAVDVARAQVCGRSSDRCWRRGGRNWGDWGHPGVGAEVTWGLFQPTWSTS